MDNIYLLKILDIFLFGNGVGREGGRNYLKEIDRVKRNKTQKKTKKKNNEETQH